MLLGKLTTWIFNIAPILQLSLENIHIDQWHCERLKIAWQGMLQCESGAGHFLFLVYLPTPGVWGSEGRGKNLNSVSVRLLKFRINPSLGNSAHLLSFSSTKRCGTAEHKVSNNFKSSCWKKYSWMQSKHTSESENGVFFLPRHVPSFHVKGCWKYYPCIIICFSKNRDLRKKSSSSADGCTTRLLNCWSAGNKC